MHNFKSKAKPDLAILIGSALGKKGAPMKPDMEESMEDESDASDHKSYLKEIAKDLLMAIKANDVDAVAELLEEAFEACEMKPHMEGKHLGEE